MLQVIRNAVLNAIYSFKPEIAISPNEILATHSDSKTLTGHNFNNYEFYTIKDIESNENNNIICKYNNPYISIGMHIVSE